MNIFNLHFKKNIRSGGLNPLLSLDPIWNWVFKKWIQIRVTDKGYGEIKNVNTFICSVPPSQQGRNCNECVANSNLHLNFNQVSLKFS